MDAEIKRRWIERLRSGEIPQTTGRLERVPDSSEKNPGFCCLGVLCEIAVEDSIIQKTFRTYDNLTKTMILFDEYESYLPDSVVKWADIPNGEGASLYWREIKPFLTETELQTPSFEGTYDLQKFTLADLNDNGVSFATIANIIEEKL